MITDFQNLVFLPWNCFSSVFNAWNILALVGISFWAILFRVTLFKDATLPLSTAILHYFITKLSSVLGIYFNWKERQDSNHLKAVQDGVLQSILSLNGQTEYGKKYKLHDVKTREDFVKAHPVTKYAHYADSIKRMMAGEQNILTKEHVPHYGTTSGTTGALSTIPYVKSQQRSMLPYYGMLSRIVAGLLPMQYRYKRIMRLSYTPTRLLSTAPSGASVGPISSYMHKSILNKRDVYTTPLEGFEIPDSAAAQYVHVLFGLRYENLTCIEAIFVSLVYFAFQTMEQDWKELVTDIRRGTIKNSLNIPDDTRIELTKRLYPMPDRADKLEIEFSKGFDNIAVRIWPKLTLIIAIKSGSFQQYAKTLQDKFTKGVRIFTPYYASTEGFFGYNHCPEKETDSARFLLAARSVFFEFLPLENTGESDLVTRFADEVEKGQEYELVLTNRCGLYRYRVGDVVRVVDFYQQLPIIEFVGRSSQQLNIRSEKVSEVVLMSAITHLDTTFLAKQNFSRIADFTFCESVLISSQNTKGSDSPYYVLFLELRESVSKENVKLENDLGHELDQYLRKSHHRYNYQRENLGLSSAKVLLVEPGTFPNMREFMIKNSGTSPAQLKIPRVLNKQSLVEFLCATRLS